MRLQRIWILEVPVRFDKHVPKARVGSALGRVVEAIVPAAQERETDVPRGSEEEIDGDGARFGRVVCGESSELRLGDTVEEADDVTEVEVYHACVDVAVEGGGVQILRADLFVDDDKG